MWDDYFSRELDQTDEGQVVVRTDATADHRGCDLRRRAGSLRVLARITRPTLFVRATNRWPGNRADRVRHRCKRYAEEVEGAQVVDVAANHYTIATNADALSAIAGFLG